MRPESLFGGVDPFGLKLGGDFQAGCPHCLKGTSPTPRGSFTSFSRGCCNSDLFTTGAGGGMGEVGAQASGVLVSLASGEDVGVNKGLSVGVRSGASQT